MLHPDLRADVEPLVPATAGPAPTSLSHGAVRPGSVLGATVLTVLAGAFWGALALLQAALFAADPGNPTVAGLAVWNMLLVGVYGWIARGLWHWHRSALSWARGTHLLNAIVCAYQAFNGVPLLIVAVPLHALGWIFARAAGRHFAEASSPRTATRPGLVLGVVLAVASLAVFGATAGARRDVATTRSSAPASAARAGDPGAERRAVAARITQTMAERQLPVRLDTTGPDDTTLRVTSAACGPAVLAGLSNAEQELAGGGFLRAICVDEVGRTVAERPLTRAPTRPPGEAGDATPADPRLPFETYVRARFRGASVSVTGGAVYVDGVRCSRRFFDAVGRMADAPDLLAAALRSPVQSMVCRGDGGEPVTRRWPSPGVRIPEAVDWERRYVVTPAGRHVAPATVWCFHDGRGGLPGALCFRDEGECTRRRAEVVEMYRGMGGGAKQASEVRPCRVTPRLWCFQTRGTEQQCTVTRDACEEWRGMDGERGSECEERNAL